MPAPVSWFLVGVLLSLASPTRAQSPREIAREHVARNGVAILTEFMELLALPNVAGDVEGIGRNVDWLIAAFERRGVSAEALTLKGASPLIVGRLPSPGATRTLGVYIHYDGQPVDPTRWTHPPFTPALLNGALPEGGQLIELPEPGSELDPEWRLYARSAGDDKAPVIAWLAALDALRAAEVPPTVNLLFLLEGEEEAGSPHLAEYLERHGAALAVDAWLFCDGPAHTTGRPQLAFGVRGVTGFEITVYGALRPLHSGHYGNWAPNPALELARLLTSMKDADGRVLVEGFYDDVVPPTAGERTALAALPDADADLRHELGLHSSEGEDALAERLLLPSLNIRGLSAAGVGEAARNVIPSQATASLDIRLVKGNDPEAMLDRVERHVAAQGYHVIAHEPSADERRERGPIARFTRGGGYPAARTPLDDPLVAPLVARVRELAGDELVLVPSFGGSLPLYLFTEGLGRPTVIVPIANADDNQHAADENLRLGNLFYGIELAAALATMP